MTTAYIGAIGGDGLTTAAVHADGSLTVTGVHGDVREPSFLVFSPDKTLLYAVVEADEGGVTVLDVSNEPTVKQVVPTGQEGPTHLAFHDGHFVLAHYPDGHLTAHKVADDGTVSAPVSRLRHPGEKPHAHQVVSHGEWLIAVDLGVDAVFTHRLVDGVLVEHARVDLPEGTGPRHLAFQGDRAFLLGEHTPGVTFLDFVAATGEFRVTGHRLVTGPGAPETVYPAEIEVHDGHLYTSNRGEDVVALVGLDGELRQSAPCGGEWPRHFATGPDGRWLYVANQNTGNVAWLPRDPATGTLGEPAGSVAVPGASMIAFR